MLNIAGVEQKLVYKEGITSTVDAVRSRLTAKVRERLEAEAGFDDAALEPTYSISALDSVVKILAQEFFTGTPEQQQFDLGVVAMKRYGESALGKALFPLIRLLGPMKFLKRTAALFRQTNNYADVKVEVTGPTSYVLDHNEVGSIPEYFRGVLEASGTMIGLKNYRCALLEYDGHRARYRISWDP